MTLDRSKVWTGSVNEKALDPQPRTTVGLYDTTLRDGEQTIGVVLTPEREARDRPRARRGRHRPDRGRLPPGIRGRLRGRADDRLGRVAGRDLGLLARGAGRRRRARRDRCRRVGDREPDLRRQAGRPRRLARDDARADLAAPCRSRPRTASASRSSAWTPPGPTSTSSTAPTRQRSTRAPRRSSSSTRSGSRRPRPPRSSSRGRSTASTSPSTGTATTTSGSAPPPRSRPCRRVRRGCRARSTAWGSGRGTPTSSRSRSRSRRSTGSRRGSTSRRRGRSRALVAERAGTPLPPWKAVTGEALFTRESGAVAAQFHDPPAIEPYASELVGAEARDRARQEERHRLDPDRARAARPRRTGGAARRAARRGQGARDEAAVAS